MFPLLVPFVFKAAAATVAISAEQVITAATAAYVVKKVFDEDKKIQSSTSAEAKAREAKRAADEAARRKARARQAQRKAAQNKQSAN